MPPHVLELFQSVGTETDMDVAEVFISTDEVLTLATERGWMGDEYNQVATAWSEARHRSQRARAAGTVRTASTSTPLPRPPSTSTALSRPPAPSTSTAASSTPTPSPAPATSCSSPTVFLDNFLSPETHNAVKEQDKTRKDTGMGELKSMWMAMGARGLHWQRGPPHVQEMRLQFLLRAGLRLTGSTVKKHVKAWTAWQQWATRVMGISDENAIYSPDSVLLAQFLDTETARGPTLGRSRTQSFRWLREKLGLPFPIDDIMVADFKHSPLEYTSKSAATFSPATLLNVLSVIHEHSAAKAQEPLVVLFLAFACLRHKHVSISRITGHNADFIFGHCPQGKCRRRGTRPPFSWAIPRPFFLKDAFAFVLQAAERMGFPDFVVPARAKTR